MDPRSRHVNHLFSNGKVSAKVLAVRLQTLHVWSQTHPMQAAGTVSGDITPHAHSLICVNLKAPLAARRPTSSGQGLWQTLAPVGKPYPSNPSQPTKAPKMLQTKAAARSGAQAGPGTGPRRISRDRTQTPAASP